MSEHTPHIVPKLSETGSIASEYFDRLYAEQRDPWEFATSRYEASKYAATLEALPLKRYLNAFEPGCSIGVLTRQLASRCERLLATDLSEPALSQARVRCADFPGVTFELRNVSLFFPDESFDLIVLSEVGYYLSLPDLENLRARIATSLSPQGLLLLVHYTGETNYPLTADAVHEVFLEWEGQTWDRIVSSREDSYRLDLLQRTMVAPPEPLPTAKTKT